MEVQTIENVKINIEESIKNFKLDKNNNKEKSREDYRNILNDKELKKLETKINNVAASLNFEIEFQIHKKSKKFYVKIVDKNTNKVIREIPPEQLLDFYANFEKMLGILFNGRS